METVEQKAPAAWKSTLRVVARAALRLMARLLGLAVAGASVALCYLMSDQPDEAFLDDGGDPTGPPRWVFLFYLVVSSAFVVLAAQSIARWWRKYLGAVPIVQRAVAVLKFAARALWLIAVVVVGGFMVWAILAGILLPNIGAPPLSLNEPIENLLAYFSILVGGVGALIYAIGSIYESWRDRPSFLRRAGR